MDPPIIFPEFICVLDFEADVENYPNEIIEFTSVLLQWDSTIANYEQVSTFQEYCKPLVKSELTKFCTELMGITQKQVVGGDFCKILPMHYEWLYELTKGNVTLLTCSFWDLGRMMIEECKKWAAIPPIKKNTKNL